MKIPKKIHFIWAGGQKLPKSDYIKSLLNWQAANPNFTIHLWIDQVSYGGGAKKDLKEAFRKLIQREADKLISKKILVNMETIQFRDISELNLEASIKYRGVLSNIFKPSQFGIEEKDMDVKPIKISENFLKVLIKNFRQNLIDNLTKNDQQLARQKKPLSPSDALAKVAEGYGFSCKNVFKDGNCFFHAVSHQLGKTPEKLREIASEHILRNLELYKNYIGEDINSFIERMSKPGTWADNILIQALSRELNITIAIVRSDAAPPIILKRENPVTTVYLGYEVGLHYQSLVEDPQRHTLKIEQAIIEASIDRLPFVSENFVWELPRARKASLASSEEEKASQQKTEECHSYVRYEIDRLYANYGASSDLIRYLILIKEGGVYLDFDVEPFSKSLEETKLFDVEHDAPVMLANNFSQRIEGWGNDAFVATPNSPYMQLIYDLAETGYFCDNDSIVALKAESMDVYYELDNPAPTKRAVELKFIEDAYRFDESYYLFKITPARTGPGCCQAVFERFPEKSLKKEKLLKAGWPKEELETMVFLSSDEDDSDIDESSVASAESKDDLPFMVKKVGKVYPVGDLLSYVKPFEQNGLRWFNLPVAQLVNLEEGVSKSLKSMIFEIRYLGYFRLEAHIHNIHKALPQVDLKIIAQAFIQALEKYPLDFERIRIAPLTFTDQGMIDYYKKKNIFYTKTGIFPLFTDFLEGIRAALYTKALNNRLLLDPAAHPMHDAAVDFHAWIQNGIKFLEEALKFHEIALKDTELVPLDKLKNYNEKLLNVLEKEYIPLFSIFNEREQKQVNFLFSQLNQQAIAIEQAEKKYLEGQPQSPKP